MSDTWSKLITEGEANGCYPCDTCNGVRARGMPCASCQWKIQRFEEYRHELGVAKEESDEFYTGNETMEEIVHRFWACIRRKNAKIRKLEADLEQWEAAAKHVMCEKCSPNEVHCTCVPLMRVRIERLEKKLKKGKK